MVQSYRDRRVGGWRIWNPQYLGAQWNFVFYFFFKLHVDYSFLVLPALSTSISNKDVEYTLLHISTSYVCHFNAMIFSTRVVATCNHGTILLYYLLPGTFIITWIWCAEASFWPCSPTYLPHFAKGKNMPYWSFFRYNSITTKKKKELRKCQSPAHIVWVAHSL